MTNGAHIFTLVCFGMISVLLSACGAKNAPQANTAAQVPSFAAITESDLPPFPQGDSIYQPHQASIQPGSLPGIVTCEEDASTSNVLLAEFVGVDISELIQKENTSRCPSAPSAYCEFGNEGGAVVTREYYYLSPGQQFDYSHGNPCGSGVWYNLSQ